VSRTKHPATPVNRRRSAPATDTPTARGRLSRAVRALGQISLGAAMVGAGVSHLTVAREEFQAQVPSWFPGDTDTVVLVSGVAEIALGSLMLTVWKQPHRGRVGTLLALFYAAIFPGNVAQYLERKDGFGLDTDAKRLARLPFQGVLIAGALAATRRAR
jgi:uncharacterized membrane protein